MRVVTKVCSKLCSKLCDNLPSERELDADGYLCKVYEMIYLSLVWFVVP